MKTTGDSEVSPVINSHQECCIHHECVAGHGDGSVVAPASATLLKRISDVPGLAAIGAVRAYQYLISPMLGQRCRFYPSCSQYFILSVAKFGLMRALWKGIGRICRCHPWNAGGYDPP